MNFAHVHLIVNHVSIFALAIGVVSLALSMKRRSGDLRALASILFVLAGIFAWVTVETGQRAEDVVKALGGDTESFIHQHALAAVWAERSGAVIGLLAIAMEWAMRKKIKWAKALQWVLLILALHGFTVFARTAYLGGLIRHTEVRN